MNWTTKQEIRADIWDKLTKEDIAQFPLPCYGRIPNFLGVEEASKLLLDLPEFKKARFIFSAPDHVLHYLREFALKNKKTLLIATPHIQKFLLLKDVPLKMIKRAVTIKGMYQFGEEVRINQISRPLDLFCEGSVAIDRHGNRLGKGKGYGDREFQLLKHEGIIDAQTKVLTIIHDLQLLDDFTYLVTPSDVKVHIVLTPTEIIRI
ncbi:MAG: 5-formyltetrahydrofolate cyclo-ligase [Candidatus Helarchaeota archaeon]